MSARHNPEAVLPWPRHARVAFVDVDYARASRVWGTRWVRTRGPETWQVERVGIVWATTGRSELVFDRDELIAGPAPATSALSALRNADLIVGHGLLQGDLRAFAMVTVLPDELLDRSVDLLIELHEVRGGRFPTGLNLSDLARLNLRTPRAKPAKPMHALPEMRRFESIWPAERGSHDPRDDAQIVARMWQTLLSSRTVSWADGHGGAAGSPLGGHGFSGAAGKTVGIDKAAVDRLAGVRRLGAQEWRRRVDQDGSTLSRAPGDYDAAKLAKIGAASTRADLSALHRCAEALLGDQAALLHPEQLLTAFQFLGSQANTDSRQALVKRRFFASKPRVGEYLWALWRVTQPEKCQEWFRANQARQGSALAELRWHRDIRPEQDALRQSCYQLADQLC